MPTEPERIVGGRYRLVEQLGAGGFGRVWKALDEALGVPVAVKEVWLPQRQAGSEEHRAQVVRATREARNAARLRDHPHVVAVHDVVVEEGTPWIVMRLVEGRSLEERIRAEGALSSAAVEEIAAALLKAVKAAHAAGIVHRDIKPGNVMVTGDGQVLLADFGIAVHEADTRLTTTGGLIGSAEYMAPERLNGAQDHPTADLFALGATLYKAVEGVSPFHRDTTTATIAAVALHDPPPMRNAGPVLAGVITAFLAKEPGERPDIDGALSALGTAAPTGTDQAAPPPPAADPPSASGERGPWSEPVSWPIYAGRLVVGGCSLLAGLGLIAFGCFMYLRQGGDPVAYPVATGSAALTALFFGTAATFYRWRGRGRAPFGVLRTVFLSVFLPLALVWALWNTVLLA
ncbi:serine/threonine-protein kinase [Nocardiopsis halophila]|uniref:serine/threonine-protein kinase n=1 Tax=Nocardiopsis halophila TaxID=141692 RepID=UPI00034C201B|nr:serine/threonine-protein kinase [Nocardiopsis halophila]